MTQAALPIVALLLLASCNTPPAEPEAAPAPRGIEVVETMDSGGYTYVRLATSKGRVWYAVPQCKVAVGDRVEVAAGAMQMNDFKSGTLDRTFKVIYFASGLEKVGE